MTTPEAASKVLRKGFPADEVGKLPKISCTQCTKAPNKVCDRHGGKKAKCRECGAFITTAHVHLDYVGHAGVTNRLLDADPSWTWEPVAWDAEGAPLVQHGKNESVMWVRLTVGGVTRYGVGSAPLGSFELHKQLVSDAIRNASMRFGVALALWAKEPLPEAIEQDAPHESPGGGDAGRPSTADVASPGVPAPDREVPTAPPVVEPVVSHDDEVGTAPPGGSPLPGGNDAAGGRSAAARVAPEPPPAPSGDVPTLADLDASLPTNKWNRNKVLREARRIAKDTYGLQHPPADFESLANPEFARLLADMCEAVGVTVGKAAGLTDKQRKFMHAVWAKHGGDNARKAEISRLTSGRTDSTKDLDPGEVKALMDLTAALDGKEATA